MKLTNSMSISLAGLLILAILGWRGADVSMAISGIVLAYVGSRSGQKIGLGLAVSRDQNANSENVIDKLKD